MGERTNTFLEFLDTGEREKFEAYLEPFTAVSGDIIYSAGEVSKGVYLIDEGCVRIHTIIPGRKNEAQEQHLIKGPGEYFGEFSLLDRRKHLGTVTVVQDLQGRMLHRDNFYHLIDKNPAFALNLARDIIHRTRHADRTFINELARSKTAAEMYIDRLKSIERISKVLNSTLDLDQLLGLIISEATNHTKSDSGTIYLVDKEKNELYSRVMGGDKIEEIRLPIGKGISGHVAATGETVNIPDAYADERFNPEIDKLTGYKTNNLLTMPMRSPEQEIVGVIQLINKKSGEFRIDDENFINAMSVHASIAIQQSKMAEEKAKNQSLTSLGRFAATIIHDIKNPMTVIRGYAQLLESMYPDAQGKKYLQVIEDQIDRLVGMTQEILDFARGEIKLHLAEVVLKDYLERICTTLGEDCGQHDIEMITNYHGLSDQKVLFDEGRMTRVLFNIAGNARDAMTEGGKLTIRSACDDRMWMISIGDTGCGIEEERLPHIFESFHTSGKKNGTGLGLAIAKKVVEDHQGKIDVKSVIGEGTTFTLSFPLYPDVEAEKKA